jgi:hypothetical protein
VDRRAGLLLLAFAALVLLVKVEPILHVSDANIGGTDLRLTYWAPTRGLLDGINVYLPDNEAYFDAYDVDEPVALYLPSDLLVHAPLAALPFRAAVGVYMTISIAAIWLSLVLLARPRQLLDALRVGLLGVALCFTLTAESNLTLGQSTPIALLGLVLLLRYCDVSPWISALGFTLAALKPQTAIPLAIALVVLGKIPCLARSALLIVGASVPWAILAVPAAGGVHRLVRTLGANARHFEEISGSSTPNQTRIDAAGVLDHLGISPTRVVQLLIFVTAMAVFAFAARHARGSRLEANVIVLIGLPSAILLSMYHREYDFLLVLGSGCSAMLLARGWSSIKVVCASLLAFQLLTRPSLRGHIQTATDVSFSTVVTWTSGITAAGIVALLLLSLHRPAAPEPAAVHDGGSAT